MSLLAGGVEDLSAGGRDDLNGPEGCGAAAGEEKSDSDRYQDADETAVKHYFDPCFREKFLRLG